MGGFVAGPGGLMAKVLGIPLVLHEQNRIPGTTNRLLVKHAKKVLEAFPESFPLAVNAVCTGNPLRQTFINLPEKTLWQPDCDRHLHVLVVGGSQGAKALNEAIPAALATFEDVEIKHQTGTAQCEEVRQRYTDLHKVADVLPFIDDMAAAYQWADLVICRAGAMTVSEVAAAGLPAIFIPLPGAIDDHQTANARYLTENGAARLLPQTYLTQENLVTMIEEIRTQLTTMGHAARQQARLQATSTVAAICEAEAKA
jgi:UDP-N-acetylglucosamine--N-acetylmuramyl-(pentapeptide) pyrophosphoryl-undecaprenol N-acetylglucosamine transferase